MGGLYGAWIDASAESSLRGLANAVDGRVNDATGSALDWIAVVDGPAHVCPSLSASLVALAVVDWVLVHAETLRSDGLVNGARRVDVASRCDSNPGRSEDARVGLWTSDDAVGWGNDWKTWSTDGGPGHWRGNSNSNSRANTPSEDGLDWPLVCAAVSLRAAPEAFGHSSPIATPTTVSTWIVALEIGTRDPVLLPNPSRRANGVGSATRNPASSSKIGDNGGVSNWAAAKVHRWTIANGDAFHIDRALSGPVAVVGLTAAALVARVSRVASPVRTAAKPRRAWTSHRHIVLD